MTESDDLKFADEEFEDVPRTAEAIARRALVISAVLGVVYGSPRGLTLEWLESEGLTDAVSPHESDFLNGRTTEEARISLSWRMECLPVLLWCTGKLDGLPGLSKQCKSRPLQKAIVQPPGSTADYIASAQLRDRDEIEAEYDTVYEAHWKVRDAQLNNRPVPKNLNAEVVYERHYAFNWVIGYGNQDWDDISTDT